MSIRNSTVTAFVGAAILGGFLLVPPAVAQDGGGSEKHVIIRTPDGTREIHISSDGLGGDGDQIMVVSIAGNGGNFTFVGNPNELPFGDSLGPMGIAALANAGANPHLAIIDPGTSYIYQLLKRPDVRSDLFLDSKQREQLEALENEENQANQQRFDQLKGAIKGGGANSTSGADDKANGVAERAKSLHGLMQGSSTERDKKLAEILTAKQIKRLNELDLQYRGPLAMGVKPVAEKAKVVDPQAPAVAGLLKEYRDSVRKALGIEEKVTRTQGADGSTSVSVNQNVSVSSPDEMRARLEKAHDEIENSRRTLGDKALKTVTEEQRSEWKKLVGAKFQFVTLN